MSATLKSTLRTALCLTAALLLCLALCACGGKAPTPAVSDGNVPVTDGDALASDGNAWATDGDAWATDGDAWASDGNAWASDGNAFFYASDATEAERADAETLYATDGNAQTAKEVRVSTVDELLDAVAPDTTVILAPGTYDLSGVQPLARPYCYWRPVYDGGFELVFSNLTNFVLRGESGQAADVSILVSPRMANVMNFESCSNIQLIGFTAGHAEGEGVCSAGVLRFSAYTSSVYIANCDLFGCGSTGLWAEGASALTVKDTVIRDCVYDAVNLNECHYVLFDGCEFTNCGESDVFNIYNSGWVTVRDSLIHENTMPVLLYCGNSSAVSFECCEISSNTFNALYSPYCSGVDFNSCTLPFTTYAQDYLDFYEGSSLVRVNGVAVEPQA